MNVFPEPLRAPMQQLPWCPLLLATAAPAALTALPTTSNKGPDGSDKQPARLYSKCACHTSHGVGIVITNNYYTDFWLGHVSNADLAEQLKSSLPGVNFDATEILRTFTRCLVQNPTVAASSAAGASAPPADQRVRLLQDHHQLGTNNYQMELQDHVEVGAFGHKITYCIRVDLFAVENLVDDVCKPYVKMELVDLLVVKPLSHAAFTMSHALRAATSTLQANELVVHVAQQHQQQRAVAQLPSTGPGLDVLGPVVIPGFSKLMEIACAPLPTPAVGGGSGPMGASLMHPISLGGSPARASPSPGRTSPSKTTGEKRKRDDYDSQQVPAGASMMTHAVAGHHSKHGGRGAPPSAAAAPEPVRFNSYVETPEETARRLQLLAEKEAKEAAKKNGATSAGGAPSATPVAPNAPKTMDKQKLKKIKRLLR